MYKIIFFAAEHIAGLCIFLVLYFVSKRKSKMHLKRVVIITLTNKEMVVNLTLVGGLFKRALETIPTRRTSSIRSTTKNKNALTRVIRIFTSPPESFD